MLPGQYLLIALNAYVPFLIWVPLFGFLLLPVFGTLFTATEDFLDRASAATLWGLMVCVTGISHVAGADNLLACRVMTIERR